MIGKKDEAFIAQEDIPLVRFDFARARTELKSRGGDGADSSDEDGDEGDHSRVTLTRQIRYCRLLANGEKVWVFAVGFDTRKNDRLMLFYQEHIIQDEMEENEKLLEEAEGDIEKEYDTYMADLNRKVEVAIARSYTMSSQTYAGTSAFPLY